MQKLDVIFELVAAERAAQFGKWSGEHEWGSGDCSSPLVDRSTKLAVLTEEIGEVARAYLEKDDKNLREELIQVAAVAVAWLQDEVN